jgi:hypothetical protein
VRLFHPHLSILTNRKGKEIYRNPISTSRFVLLLLEDYSRIKFLSKTFNLSIIEHWIILGEVLVVHFEDVVDDKVYEVERVLGFLHTALDKRRMECMKNASLDFYRRRSKIMQQNIFSEQISSSFKKNIDVVNDFLLQFGGIPYANK